MISPASTRLLPVANSVALTGVSAIARLPQDPDVDLALGQHLTQERAFESMIAVVQTDRRVTGEQGGTETLLKLLLCPALGDHRHQPPGREHSADVDQEALAGAGAWRRERMQGCRGHAAPIERGQHP